MRRDADQDLITHMPLYGMLDMPVRLGPNARGSGTYPWGGLRARIVRARRRRTRAEFC